MGSFGGSSRPRDWTGVFCHGRRILYLLRRQESPSATLTSLQQQWEKAEMEHCLQWCEGKFLQLATVHADKQSVIEGGIKTCANMQGLKNMLCSQNYWRMCSTKPRESPRKGKSQDPGNRRCKQDGGEEDPKTTSVFWHGGQAVQVGITIRIHTEARQLSEPRTDYLFIWDRSVYFNDHVYCLDQLKILIPPWAAFYLDLLLRPQRKSYWAEKQT